ncbi:MAG TPA: hypothetical protein VF157_09140 [Chloroflexota bacterium]
MEVERFLSSFLPRLERLDGVIAAYHYTNQAAGESSTIIIWRDEAARTAYLEGDLIKEAIEQEKRLGLQSKRESFQLDYPG